LFGCKRGHACSLEFRLSSLSLPFPSCTLANGIYFCAGSQTRSDSQLSILQLGDSVDRFIHIDVGYLARWKGVHVEEKLVPVEGGQVEGREMHVLLTDNLNLVHVFVSIAHFS